MIYFISIPLGLLFIKVFLKVLDRLDENSQES